MMMPTVAFALSKLTTVMQSDVCLGLSYFQGRTQMPPPSDFLQAVLRYLPACMVTLDIK